MSVVEQSKVVAEVERHGRGKNRRLRELGISRSTYYWWRWRHRQGSWEGTEGTERPWNRLLPEEEAVVLAAAREMPTWRSRQLAAWLTDHRGLSVSASAVYRILRREGLVKRIEYQLAAGKEYQHKTTGPHQLWATDASGGGGTIRRSEKPSNQELLHPNLSDPELSKTADTQQRSAPSGSRESP